MTNPFRGRGSRRAFTRHQQQADQINRKIDASLAAADTEETGTDPAAAMLAHETAEHEIRTANIAAGRKSLESMRVVDDGVPRCQHGVHTDAACVLCSEIEVLRSQLEDRERDVG